VAVICVGTDFNDVSLEKLGRLETEAENIWSELHKEAKHLQGSIVLATCNRFEIYFESENFHESVEYVTNKIAGLLDLNETEAKTQLKLHYGPTLVRHIFAVSSGLKSMALGENEIRGQVRKALQKAKEQGLATPVLTRMFEAALSAARRVLSDTSIAETSRSLVDVALQQVLANRKPEELRTLVVGTGSYSKVIVKSLRREGITKIGVFSHSGRAGQFARNNLVEAIDNETLGQAMQRFDLVITARGGHGYLIDSATCRLALTERDEASFSLLDLASSSDVDPQVRSIAGVSLLTLAELRHSGGEEDFAALDHAEQIIGQEVVEFEEDQRARGTDPIVTALRAHVGLWVEKEVETVRKKAGDQTAIEVEQSLQRVMNAMLHTPTLRAKDIAKTGDYETYQLAVKLLFDIELGQS
jgi:glutamyl-tRNA reductase